jgi:hypothetical protein
MLVILRGDLQAYPQSLAHDIFAANEDWAVRLFFPILFALGVGAALGDFGLGTALAGMTEFEFAALDANPLLVKPPQPGQSYGCDPLVNAKVIDNRFSRKATVWVNQTPSEVAVRVSDDGRRLLLMRAADVFSGVTDPEEFKITLNSNSTA